MYLGPAERMQECMQEEWLRMQYLMQQIRKEAAGNGHQMKFGSI